MKIEYEEYIVTKILAVQAQPFSIVLNDASLYDLAIEGYSWLPIESSS